MQALHHAECSSVTDKVGLSYRLVTPETLASTLNAFLASARDAVVLEDSGVRFALAQAKHALNSSGLNISSGERSSEPLLFLVAPALQVYPPPDGLLRYISPQINWTLVGNDERWRDRVRRAFTKRQKDLRIGPLPLSA